MGAFFTQIAGQFAKPFFMSALLPVVIVLSLFTALTYPLFPGAFGNPPGFDLLTADWTVAWHTFAVVVASMLLYVLNGAIIRFFSGYPWMELFPGTWLTAWRRRQFESLRGHRDGLALLASTLTANDAEKAQAARLRSAMAASSHHLNSSFPYRAELVLPTRLGNILRNAEDYCRQQYGISSVPLWPRLLAVIPTEYKEILSEAKTSFDFALNTLFLLLVAAVVTMTLAFAGHGDAELLRAAGWRTLAYLGLAGLAFAMTLVRAHSWGLHIKAAVDLYRKALLDKLGYTQKPADIAAERETLWTGIVQEWDFPDLEPSSPVPFAPPAAAATIVPSARGAAAGATLVVARGVSAPTPPPYPLLTVTLQVTNTGAAPSGALTVTDAPPANWTYVWASASTAAGPVRVTQTTPLLRFEADPLAPSTSVLISYQVRALAP
jgi:uncharacterized repeat protein (TIGR01451 family)